MRSTICQDLEEKYILDFTYKKSSNALEGVGFPDSSVSKESACNAGDPDLIPGKIPWRKERLPTPLFWPGEFHGLDSP